MNKTPGRAGSPLQLSWLLLLFAGSGCAALIYEIVWFQLLQLVIGLTNVSLGLLLGVFMGGMCIGSLLLPRLMPGTSHPLRVYALLELGIAAIGTLLLFVIPWVADLYTSFAGAGVGGMVLRGALVSLCLLPPTVLMGATLPAIARWVECSKEGVSWMGFFYGGNIAGAVLGCLLAGFYLLRVHDMATATYAAAGINVVVAIMALVGSRKGACAGEAAVHQVAAKPEGIETSAGSAHGPIYVAIALSGMTALGAEVVWTRLLSLLMGGTVYTFSIILALFLIGLGLGSGVGSLLARTMIRPRAALAGCQFLLMLAVAWAEAMMVRSLPNWPINPALSSSPWFNFQLDLARGLWVVLPAAILWGTSFPLALASVSIGSRDPGRLVGGVYAANTVGAILGALLFSLAVVPQFGTQHAGQGLIVISAVAGLIAMGLRPFYTRPGSGRYLPVFRLVFTASVAVVVAMVLAAGVAPTPWALAAYGRYVPTFFGRLAPAITAETQVPAGGVHPDIYCTYYGEGLNGTIAVTKMTSGVRNFHSAGKVQASNDPRDMRLQRMLGHLSALVNEKPESVLVVACGAGVTAGSFVTHPETKRIVICDIEPLVPKMVAPMFAKENYNVVSDPRTQVVSDDGRHFIRTTQEKFDVITSDPIDPWVKGCAALNTVEYYQMCKAHLKPGGVMSLWIPLYESDAVTVKSVISTFFKVFPNGVLWSNDDDGHGYDAVLFGQAEPSLINLDKLQARLDRPDHARVKKSMVEAGFPTAIDLLATYAGQAIDLQEWMSGAQINTDQNMRLQYLAGWAVNSFLSGEILNQIRIYQRYPENLFTGSAAQQELLKVRLNKLAQTDTPVADKPLTVDKSR